jgi:AraC family transcriptional regulator, regulatory protein of adaptative response / methylphosphotriester-DNA alkyltransferase methyltransferase
VRNQTVEYRRSLYLLSRGVVARHYSRPLTLATLARTLCSSPRQIQRAYEQFGPLSFHDDLRARRLTAAATLLYEQPAIAVADVARLVGYRQPAHFARAFRLRFGVAPAGFRERARRHRAAISAAAAARGPDADGAIPAGAAARGPDGDGAPAPAGSGAAAATSGENVGGDRRRGSG